MNRRLAARPLFAGSLLIAAVTSFGLGAQQTQPSAHDPSPGSPQVEAPSTLPAQCLAARERAGQLRAELEATVSPKARTAAAQYVAKPGPGVSPEKAWGASAAADLLTGDVAVAAWAGLKAVEIQWTGETVTDAGIYLYHLGKQPEALQLLNCAYAMGYRSPYLLEALAVAYQKLGDVGKARKLILDAGAAAPDDIIIDTEKSFMTTGQPPRPGPAQRDPDGLDGSLRELEEHAQYALKIMKTHRAVSTPLRQPDSAFTVATPSN